MSRKCPPHITDTKNPVGQPGTRPSDLYSNGERVTRMTPPSSLAAAIPPLRFNDERFGGSRK